MAKTLKQLFTEQEQNIVQGRFHPEEPKKPTKGNLIVKPNVTENAEPITELSSETLDRYKDKAKKSSDALTSQGKYRQANDRTMNVMKATGKQINNTVANIRKALNKEETVTEGENKQVKDGDPCWTGYQMVGMKSKGGKKVPNCVPVKEEENAVEEAAKGTLHRVRYSHDSSSGNGIASGNLSLHAPDKESASRYAESDLKKRGKKNIKIHAVTPQKSSIKEAKEKTEYDYEGDMARGQLQSIINNSQRVHDMLEDNDNLPEWVQSKITLAEDYISTVANYLMSEIDEEVEQLEEGRPSQRHPLEGHEYHKKTDAELIYIAKDAHKAAEAMKSHNTDAENKYRDQANDSATVRHFRKTSGMPEWYKKKYGHINEQMANAPFDPPYSKKTGTHIDKSGAKHGPMSIARDLARTAVAKQAKSINKTDPTRKASIVREAMKDAAIKDEKKKDDKKVTSGGKDKFQPDPEISTQIIRQE